MWRAKLVGCFALIILMLCTFFYAVLHNRHHLQRDIPSLLNQYYRLKEQKPWRAKEALELILAQNPTHIQAIHALGYWYIEQGDTHSAQKYLRKVHHLFPQDSVINFQLAKLYLMLNQPLRAKAYLQQVLHSNNSKVKKKAKVLWATHFRKENTKQAVVHSSFIPSITMTSKLDLKPLYVRVQEVSSMAPELARQYLEFITRLEPLDHEAFLKLGYLHLRLKNSKQALKNLMTAFSLNADPRTGLQIGYLLIKEHEFDKARYYFLYALNHGATNIEVKARRAIFYLNQLQNRALIKQDDAVALSHKDVLLNVFYKNKTINKRLAWKIIRTLLRNYPSDVTIWTEAAYYAMAEHKKLLAIEYWKRAYQLERKPKYALSIAYLYDELGEKPQAFYYFNQASITQDLRLRYKAELGMTQIGGQQTKFLPKPWFAEVYAAPFYFSRFDLGVLPIISRAGVTLEEHHHTEFYVSYRRTQDNRSGTQQNARIQNSISQIFEDNVAITSLGVRTNPWQSVPLQTFIEVGRAEDLIFRNRPKWRSDVRGGGIYFNEWGAKPDYYFDLQFPFQWVATLYSDVIYYSRYDNNIIGTAWFRPGLRIAAYQSASVDTYLANYLILDKNHEFYNNTYVIGPGISFQPTNRLNLKFRFESLQGYYIPVNSPTTNPYGSKFYNNVALLEGFIRF